MATKDLRFCPNCSNMLYLREKEDTENVGKILLVEFCRRCAFESEPEEASTTNNIVVYEKQYKGEYIKPRIDEITFSDPAVPVTREVRCPNTDCPSNSDKADAPESEAKFIIMNLSSYSILYRCSHCSKVWKNQH